MGIWLPGYHGRRARLFRHHSGSRGFLHLETEQDQTRPARRTEPVAPPLLWETYPQEMRVLGLEELTDA